MFVTLLAVTEAEVVGASFRHRPGLGGLGAVAVSAGILSHGRVSWAKGGFLGVDVFSMFFALSGS